MENKKLNKERKDWAKKYNEKTYWLRTGRCNPSKCQSACCRYVIHSMRDSNETNEKYCLLQNSIHSIEINKITEGVHKGHIHIIKPFNCPNINICGGCKLHNKKEQPVVCDLFPHSPNDSVYDYVKEFCGYKFKRVKNPYYKRKRKIKEEAPTEE